MPNDLKPALLIDGTEHRDWTSYSIDSDLMIPADAWSFELGPVVGDLPKQLVEGKEVKVKMGEEVVMVGRIDTMTDDVSRQGRNLSLTGRDRAAVLLDCSSPIFVSKQVSLADVMAKVVRPFGITRTRIDADKTLTREKINVEPGENAWDTLQNAAEANGLWPWFSPDGTLIIGRPDYTQPPVATLKMKRDGGENNLVSLSESRDVSRRFSEVTVLGQSHGTTLEEGKHNIKATVRDSGLTWYRPKILTDHEADSLAVASARGLKFIADARLNGYTLTAAVNGHAVDMAAAKPMLWTPGQRVHLVSEPHGIDATFFIMARRFTGGRNQPARTVLTLKEDGVWQLEAHPRRRRRGKNSTPGAVVDVTGAPV